MVKEDIGRLYARKDMGKYPKYFAYLPKNLVEDSGFPFKIESSIRVKISFNKKQIIIEKI